MQFVSVLVAVVISSCVATGLASLYYESQDPYDVNDDGVANITDLSVLAAEVNRRNTQQ